MSNKISIKKLTNLIDPFKEDIFHLGKVISIEEINKKIEEVDFQVNDSDTLLEKTIKEIAFLVKNPDYAPIVIDIGFPEEGNEPLDLIFSGKLNYVAAIVRKEEQIEVDIIGSIKAAKSLFNDEIIVKDKKDIIIEPERSLHIIDLSLSTNMIKATWSDPEFCLKRLKKDFEETFPLIDKELFNDKEFKYKVMGIDFFHSEKLAFQEEDYLEEELLEYASSNPHFFIELWKNTYSHLFNEKQKLEKELKGQNNKLSKKIKNIPLELMASLKKDNINFDMNAFYEIHGIDFDISSDSNDLIKKKLNIIELIDKNYFSSVDWVKTLTETNSIEKIYEYLPKSIKNNTEILKHLISNEFKKEGYSYYESIGFKTVPVVFLKDPINAAHFLENYPVKNYDFPSVHINEMTRDKEYILKMVDNIKTNFDVLELLFRGAWAQKELKKDKDIVEAMMSKSSKVYNEIGSEWKKDINLINVYLKNNGDLSKVPSTMYKEIKDEEIIKKCIKKDYYILRQKTTPIAWRKNKDYLILMEHHVKDMEYKPEQWKKIIGEKIEDYIEFIKVCTDIYEQFPNEIKNNELVTESYINKIGSGSDIKYKIRKISKVPFGSKKFSLKMLEKRPEFISLIPPYFFEDKQFLINVFEKIDNKKISDNIINDLPKLQSLFGAFDIKDNYSLFLNTHLLSKDLNKKEAVEVKKNKI